MLTDSYRTGIIAGFAAFLMWGFIPLYFVSTKYMPPWELLAHRVVWSVLFGAFIIHIRKQWHDVYLGFVSKKLFGCLLLTSILAATNWGFFIVAIQEGEILQSSLGYYINPLLNILIGAMFLHESLRILQWLAVLLAMIGVLILSTVGNDIPVYALILALTFSTYGFVRKHMPSTGTVPSMFVETIILLPVAVLYLTYLISQGQSTFLQHDMSLIMLVVLIGPVSLTPLLAFAVAAKRLRFSTLGFLQFITPTLHFIVGIVMGETFTLPHQICFVMIWLAATIMMIDVLRQRKMTMESADG